MKIKAQIAMVMNLDKCIGCHTCSVTCKNVWTSREGVEYVWFNNVEAKPGPGYPIDWENQEKYKGGWKVVRKDKVDLVQGSRFKILTDLFANPYMPSIKNYYEPFTFNFSILKSNARYKTVPSARPYSLITGELMEKIEYGPNWEDDLGGPFKNRKSDPNLKDIEQKDMESFERSFMFYLPRICEHCLHPACLHACPSGAIYKREKDGIVLIDQDKCRGWRECVSACPFKKTYFNWRRQRSEKCIFCFPLIENGLPTTCSHSCVGRIRYLGVMLFDEEKIQSSVAVSNPADLYESQLDIFLDPNDPAIYEEALKQGISYEYLEAAKISPVYKMIKEWKIAFPLHPEFRTFPMVWYIPPMSPILQEMNKIESSDMYVVNVADMRIPIKYIANMLTAGREDLIIEALEKLIALRKRKRQQMVDGVDNPEAPKELGLTQEQYEEMYRYLAIANYEDRYVVPTAAYKCDKDLFELRSEGGYEYPEGTNNDWNVFGGL